MEASHPNFLGKTVVSCYRADHPSSTAPSGKKCYIMRKKSFRLEIPLSFVVEEVVYGGTENGENGKSCSFGRVRIQSGHFKKQTQCLGC